jgi:hypothetical protein
MIRSNKSRLARRASFSCTNKLHHPLTSDEVILDCSCRNSSRFFFPRNRSSYSSACSRHSNASSSRALLASGVWPSSNSCHKAFTSAAKSGFSSCNKHCRYSKASSSRRYFSSKNDSQPSEETASQGGSRRNWSLLSTPSDGVMSPTIDSPKSCTATRRISLA